MPYVCFNCEFESTDQAEIETHNKSIVHTHRGTAPCNMCGVSTDYVFVGKRSLTRSPAICDSCKTQIISEAGA